MPVQQSTIGALGRCWYSRILYCIGTAETVGALGRLGWYRRVLKHSGGCAGTAEYYRNTQETAVVQQSTPGEAVLVGSVL